MQLHRANEMQIETKTGNKICAQREKNNGEYLIIWCGINQMRRSMNEKDGNAARWKKTERQQQDASKAKMENVDVNETGIADISIFLSIAAILVSFSAVAIPFPSPVHFFPSLICFSCVRVCIFSSSFVCPSWLRATFDFCPIFTFPHTLWRKKLYWNRPEKRICFYTRIWHFGACLWATWSSV